MIVQLDQGIIVTPSTNIEHQTELRLQILAYPLEKPLMRVDLTIISMLNSKANVYSTTFQYVISETNIPGSHLKHVQQILWHIFVGNTWIHNVSEREHG